MTSDIDEIFKPKSDGRVATFYQLKVAGMDDSQEQEFVETLDVEKDRAMLEYISKQSTHRSCRKLAIKMLYY